MTVPDEARLEARVLAAARAADPHLTEIRIDPEHADTATFCRVYGHPLAESGNCIVVTSKSGEKAYAACVVQASRRLDLNRHSRLLVGARKASFAPEDDTVALTGMLPGGVTPFGLPDDLPLFVDEPVMALDGVIVGGGSRRLKLRVAPEALLQVPGARVAAIGRD